MLAVLALHALLAFGPGGRLGVKAGGADNATDFAVALPTGTRAAWDMARAYRVTTPTRERVCLNGLWRWQPSEAAARTNPISVPGGAWGWFKVPGAWPGITDYLQKDSQRTWNHPGWGDVRPGELTSAWYEREFTVPADWTGRRIAVTFDLVNSLAEVFVDDHQVGEARFPSGAVDLTGRCQPGAKHRLSVRVTAMPMEGVLLSYTDSASAREVRGTVARRGLCGDVFLVSEPVGARIERIRTEASVQRGELVLDTRIARAKPDARYRLRARVTGPQEPTREFIGAEFPGRDLNPSERFTFRIPWRPARLWDPGTPENQGRLELALIDPGGRVLDQQDPVAFGFREFRIAGRDFYLNGSRIHLSTVPLDNAQVGAAWATYDAAKESLRRLQSFGINFVYTHHYDCLPGAHLALDEILRAADDVGMLVALSQPHFSHYDWKGAEADRTNRYAGHAEYYAGVAGHHPSVVMYAMSHNATGYNEDMNPDLIDGIHDARDEWANRNVRSARRAEALVRDQDPARIIYHHASGNLGPLHAINFYPNFAPIQELSDWFEHWATEGVKPVFLCEYGAPFTWDWTMYRGWYREQREFGSARVPWEFCLAEWNSQFVGDRAFPASAAEQANLRWEAGQFRAGQRWHRWDYPASVGSSRFEERYPIFAAYLGENWRAFRTWGVSVISPWEHEHFWKLRDGVDRRRRELPVDWDHLQRPGFSPDFLDQRYERMDLAYERDDWIATPAADALMRNNRPLLAYLAGSPSRFTAKDHLFRPGEVVEKSLVVLNDSRRPLTAAASWSVDLPGARSDHREIPLATGEQERWPLRFVLPVSTPPGRYEIRARVRFTEGETQEDSFSFDVLPSPEREPSCVPEKTVLALFDPVGETATTLARLGIDFRSVSDTDDLAGTDVLVVGKSALTPGGAAPDIRRVRDGLKVIVFEQSSAALERRFGFRVVEYGLRRVFPRVPDHPLLAGLDGEQLRDWRGEATLLPPRLQYEMRARHGPTVRWCDLPVTRLWRCGNRGNVASVLIEKPVRGDFLPVVDGGYDLQYSPLLEFREGLGAVWFCQLDVTGRSESDPAADQVTRNLLRRAATWRGTSPRRAVYAGDPAGRARLVAQGFATDPPPHDHPATNCVLILGPHGPREAVVTDVSRRSNVAVLGLGLGTQDFAALPWLGLRTVAGEHLSTGFPAFGHASPFAGIGPADLHLREALPVTRIVGGSTATADGLFGEVESSVFCQVSPWAFAHPSASNLKRSDRRLAFLLARLACNRGLASASPLLERFAKPVRPEPPERRWLQGFYLDAPEEWDDPYRFFRW